MVLGKYFCPDNRRYYRPNNRGCAQSKRNKRENCYHVHFVSNSCSSPNRVFGEPACRKGFAAAVLPPYQKSSGQDLVLTAVFCLSASGAWGRPRNPRRFRDGPPALTEAEKGETRRRIVLIFFPIELPPPIRDTMV